MESLTDLLDLLSPPGDTIAETLEARGLDLIAFERAMGLNTDAVAQLISGEARIDQAIAEKLEAVLGVDKSFWINRETNFLGNCSMIGLNLYLAHRKKNR